MLKLNTEAWWIVICL